MEQARKKMQEDYAKEVEHKLELEKAKAQQRKNLKLGINDEQEEAPKVRFDALQYVREQIVLKPVVVFSKSWCPYSR
jgi:hypothetical protein